MKVLFQCGLFLALLACQSKTKKTELPAEVDYLQSKDAAVILAQGHNRSAFFSEDGDKIFYISKNRLGHKNSQIHEYDLFLQTDRRLTFQDGEVFSVIPLNDRQIIYSSNTDEIKEAPFTKDVDPRFPKSEIYLSDVLGDEITRLTNSPGFDGEMLWVLAKKQILMTSVRSKIPGLYWLNIETENVSPFAVDKEKPQRSAALSSDGKSIFWIEEDAKAQTNTILFAPIQGKSRTVFKTLAGSVAKVLPTKNNQVIYSWLPDKAEFYQIDTYDGIKNCTQTLLKSKLQFGEPQFSVKNPGVIIFRVSNNDKSQIYRWQLPVDLGPCNEQGISDTLPK